jgi:hypothetical protein
LSGWFDIFNLGVVVVLGVLAFPCERFGLPGATLADRHENKEMPKQQELRIKKT